MSKRYTLNEIASWVGGIVRGDGSVELSGVAGISEASSTDITWLGHDKYTKPLASSAAGAVVVPLTYGPTTMPAILVPDASLAFARILEGFAPPAARPATGVHPTAVVDTTAELGADVAIGPGVVIGANARIGAGTVLHANVFIGMETVLGERCVCWPGVVVRERCRLGNGVILHPNTTIGADGFGYHYAGGRHVKIPQIGSVEIGDDVEIGANCTVDRAKFGATRIGPGTKIDNLVHVAHNVVTGAGCLVIAQTGISGSVTVGRGVILGGQVAVRDHVTLGDGAMAASRSGIVKDVPAGMTVAGMPAVESRKANREFSAVHRLPEMISKIKALTKRVDRLETSADD